MLWIQAGSLWLIKAPELSKFKDISHQPQTPRSNQATGCSPK